MLRRPPSRAVVTLSGGGSIRASRPWRAGPTRTRVPCAGSSRTRRSSARSSARSTNWCQRTRPTKRTVPRRTGRCSSTPAPAGEDRSHAPADRGPRDRGPDAIGALLEDEELMAALRSVKSRMREEEGRASGRCRRRNRFGMLTPRWPGWSRRTSARPADSGRRVAVGPVWLDGP